MSSTKSDERYSLIDKHNDMVNPSMKTSPSSSMQPSPVVGKRKETVKFSIMHPVNYGAYLFRAGGLFGSVFSLIAATLGSGTICFAYAVMMNGYVLGPLLIIMGACLSYYTGLLIVRCAEHTGRERYEDIALAMFGTKVSKFTSALNLICLMGFTFSYIVYVKGAIPQLIAYYAPNANSLIIGDGGKRFWGLVFTYCILFPMSIPRNASALRFSSLFGVLCSMYLCIAVVIVFFTDDTMVPDVSGNFNKIQAFKLTYKGVVSTVPLIIFAYMYQVNIPMIYVELENKNSSEMGKVILAGSSVAVFFYSLIGIFGYAIFVNNQEELCGANILQADFHGNSLIDVGNFCLLFSVITAAPLCVLPSKDSIEELLYKDKGMTMKQNLVVTILLLSACMIPALFIDGIGDAMVLVGSTINPVIGFFMPVYFHWQLIKDKPLFDKDKIFGLVTVAVIGGVSVLSLVQFFGPKDDSESCL